MMRCLRRGKSKRRGAWAITTTISYNGEKEKRRRDTTGTIETIGIIFKATVPVITIVISIRTTTKSIATAIATTIVT